MSKFDSFKKTVLETLKINPDEVTGETLMLIQQEYQGFKERLNTIKTVQEFSSKGVFRSKVKKTIIDNRA